MLIEAAHAVRMLVSVGAWLVAFDVTTPQARGAFVIAGLVVTAALWFAVSLLFLRAAFALTRGATWARRLFTLVNCAGLLTAWGSLDAVSVVLIPAQVATVVLMYLPVSNTYFADARAERAAFDFD